MWKLTCLFWRRITAGAVRTTDEQKKTFAKQSHTFNLSNKKFRVSGSSSLNKSRATFDNCTNCD